MNGSNLVNKTGIFIVYKNEWKRVFNLLSKNREVILNRSKDYYENDKERLRVHARDKYRNLFIK